jgi:glutathione S-transferase
VARVAVYEWLMFQMGGFGPMPGQVHHFIALQDETERRYGLARFMAETRRLYGVMDRRLAGHEHFAGDCRSPTSPSSAGSGAMRGTRSTWPSSRTCSAGTRR